VIARQGENGTDNPSEILRALEYFCEKSFHCSTIQGVLNLYDGSINLGREYPYLAGAIQSHLFMIKQEIIGSLRAKSGGHVYVVEYDNGLVKIGKTMNPDQRIKALRTMSSANVVRHFMSEVTMDPHRIESMAHRHFKAFRKHGEFFGISMVDAESFIMNAVSDVFGKTNKSS